MNKVTGRTMESDDRFHSPILIPNPNPNVADQGPRLSTTLQLVVFLCPLEIKTIVLVLIGFCTY